MQTEMSGNNAVAYGALHAGIAVAAGYPGTPSSETLAELVTYRNQHEVSPYVEWSTNEKVALEVAAGAAWSGKRALATMKMSGANVALDSLTSIAYSGTKGGLVLYIADDPGSEAGMPEQDTRLIAMLCGLPVLEPSNPRRSYELTRYAFELSEQIELPVIVRSVTSVAHAVEMLEIEKTYHPLDREPGFERDIHRFTKAGAAICLDQHQALLERLSRAEQIIREQGINSAAPSGKQKGNGCIISSGVVNQYIEEIKADLDDETHLVKLEATYPLEEDLIVDILRENQRVVIFEELEPVVEMLVRSYASKIQWQGELIGKMNGALPRTGRYSTRELMHGISLLEAETGRSGSGSAASRSSASRHAEGGNTGGENTAAFQVPGVKHTITFCAGCPHRGTYMALNRALKKTRLKRKDTVVTGDIGCTILGMNPPFDSCWTEVSMGSSIGLAQGFSLGGIRKPVVATLGDSTFFHAGIPQLINAVQHGTDLVVIILDNGWTSMTGFQVNPGTEEQFQNKGGKSIDIVKLVESIGVDDIQIVYPFKQEETVDVMSSVLTGEGVRVIIAREECALTRLRREPVETVYQVDPEACTFCKVCIRETGCPALMIRDYNEKQVVAIDPNLCTGCTLCVSSCKFDAIHPGGE
jgi:indolepyruvate ferredoxin oxidoreductase alpha subunit